MQNLPEEILLEMFEYLHTIYAKKLFNKQILVSGYSPRSVHTPCAFNKSNPYKNLADDECDEECGCLNTFVINSECRWIEHYDGGWVVGGYPLVVCSKCPSFNSLSEKDKLLALKYDIFDIAFKRI